MTKILFWNVHRKDLKHYIYDLAADTDAEVIVLNEPAENTDSATLSELKKINSSFYIPHASASTKKRFQCFCKNKSLDLSEIHSGFRTSTRKYKFINGTEVNLMLYHGKDIRNNGSGYQLSEATYASSDIEHVKTQTGTERLIVVGDFNLNPFADGMTNPRSFNAVSTRQMAKRRTRQFDGKQLDFFYNPMWGLLGDNTSPAGTIYDLSNIGIYGWSIFDQVLVHHSLLDNFKKVEILTEAGKRKLTTSTGLPDKNNGSDHFPILVTLEENK